MAEAKATKNKAKKRQKKLYELEESAEKASEEVDSKLRDDEKYVLVTIFFSIFLNAILFARLLIFYLKKNSKPVKLYLSFTLHQICKYLIYFKDVKVHNFMSIMCFLIPGLKLWNIIRN